MADEPIIDERDQEAVFETLLERADGYTDAWDPQTSDVGRTLLRIFSTFEADVRKRLNEVPEKHLLAFLDALEFARRPPQAARTPLTFTVSTDLDRNVPIPGGTRATANPGDGDTQQFELPKDGGFEATPARLRDVVGVEPTDDAIVDHGDVLEGEAIELFSGSNMQAHVLYLGNDAALNLEGGATFSVSVEAETGADRFFEATVWEYYGEDADGTEGWHRLERPADDHRDDDVGVEALQERLQSDAAGTRHHADREQRSERTFRVPGKPVEHELNGVDSRWIRCSITDADSNVLSTTVTSLSIHVASTGTEDGLEADMLLFNDVPLSADDGAIRPFGRIPQPPATFYAACQEAFTKPGAVVDLEFIPPTASAGDEAETTDSETSRETAETRAGTGMGSDGPATNAGAGVLGGPPRLSWEYWNGDGWTRLESVEDGTGAFQTAGTVQFDVPQDIEATTVSGHENVWIRARLVGGNYGQPSYEVTSDGTRGSLIDEPDSPTFGDVSIQYDRGEQPFETVFRYNNAAYSEDLFDATGGFEPFTDVPDEHQTLYLGFDDTLRNGPLTLFVPVEDTTYPQSFDPGVQWEYCIDPVSGEWAKLDTYDRTGGLTERGIVTLTFPEPTSALELFDRERHWIRARVTKDEFDIDHDPRDGQPATTETVSAGHTDSDPVAGSVPADVTSERTTSSPVLEGIYPNTQWAYNTLTVEDEVLGSSDGSHNQSFRCGHAPIIDIDVWVDERSTLSAGERRRLDEERPEAVAPEYDSRGELTAFWVRWHSVDDFLDSDPTDRHYVINRTLGVVEFGDGDNGAIPPTGQDNAKATYTTGGGSDGNVDARTVTDLKSSVALVESVSNPTPADGGADIESTDTLVSRSTNRLKHRNRAVTAQDYEQVAKAEFPELARVTCDPALGGGDGSRVTVLIVPQTEREKPVPSMELKHRVRETLYDRAPASLVADDDADIVVRGPGYGELSTEMTVRATNVKSVSLLKGAIERRLNQYLHPLFGNDGNGWKFGAVPDSKRLATVVGDVDSVAEVTTFDVTVETGSQRHMLSGHDDTQTLPRDTLVCSGTHEITVTTEGQR
ncbi:phage baseplate protein [Natronolimnobius sp. AArcel1]|uniref:baseplate J/gp47 family protein n=1 Tax=Natronolimnobius sp. AArcel1 TaxID=1679093 RepID=UPI0013EA5DD2|nr:baseplate J/gp47 family protein [Natronolimnobius sp. AArcel1]NGM68014.1 phage baseplate protein [Natronolimnobius sp. AArcel1]